MPTENVMTPVEMDDCLRPTDETFRAFFERGYSTWYSLLTTTLDDPPSTQALATESLFPEHPALPVGVQLDESGIVTAKSTWACSDGDCDIPPLEQTFQMAAASGKSTPIMLVDDPGLLPVTWLEKDDHHLVILTFAWAYALSARWAEIIPRASPIEYTASRARWKMNEVSNGIAPHPIVVELGDLPVEASRWWEAVLAPGEGWKAAIPHGRWRLLSPWSVTMDSKSVGISLNGRPQSTEASSPAPASFQCAMQYIQNYCALHKAARQSRAALAAALLLPLAKLENRTVRLHVPRMLCRVPTERAAFEISQCQREFDRLLTLSANARGMKAVLGSVFYEPGIPANACGAWLQGTIAVLRTKCNNDLKALAQMFFNRSPHIAYLWLGGTITGAHTDFLKRTHSLLGLNRIDLHEAAWTTTRLSFIQEPVSCHSSPDLISRANECRLMFLTQEPPRQVPPIYPYPPLGETHVKDTDLGVQLHASCLARHCLRFLSVTWDCVESRKNTQRAAPSGTHDINSGRGDVFRAQDTAIAMDYSWLDREKDLSEGVTRNLFAWMRDMDGYSVAERPIYQHEWIHDFNSDDDDDDSCMHSGDGESAGSSYDPSQVDRWLANTMQSNP